MVKLSTPVALLAVAVAGAFAQAPASSAASSAAGAGSSAAAPAQSSEAPPSSASPSASPSQAAGGGGGGSGGSSSAVCSALFNPSVSQVNCQESSTVVPPYNLSSLVSFFIGKYSAGPEGKMVSEVAEDMANQVVHYYPTVTASKSDIQYEGLLASIRKSDDKFAPVESMKPPKNGAASKYAVSKYVVPASVAAIAAVAGGAVLL